MTAVALVAAEGAESEHDTLLEELRAWKARPTTPTPRAWLSPMLLPSARGAIATSCTRGYPTSCARGYRHCALMILVVWN